MVWSARSIPETYDPEVRGQRLDWAGAALAALGLAGVTYALTEGDGAGWTDPTVVTLGLLGVAALAAFVAVEARGSHPMLPLDIFRNRLFSAANAMTFIVYAALAGALFLLPIQLAAGGRLLAPAGGIGVDPHDDRDAPAVVAAAASRSGSARACPWGSARSSRPSVRAARAGGPRRVVRRRRPRRCSCSAWASP